MSEDGQSTETRSNVVREIQNSLASLDHESLCAGFITVVEWVEPDGTPSMSVLHTQMAPWHLSGMLDFASKYHVGMGVLDALAQEPGGEDHFDSG